MVELTPEKTLLLDEAEKAMHNAYSPYSKFMVGAAIITQSGKIISGANFETAAYIAIHGEQAVISAANAQGYRKFKAIAIITKGEEFDTTEATAPCGNCRQLLVEAEELSGNDIEIILSTTKRDKIVVYPNAKCLLPGNFGPKDVGVDVSRYRK